MKQIDLENLSIADAFLVVNMGPGMVESIAYGDKRSISHYTWKGFM